MERRGLPNTGWSEEEALKLRHTVNSQTVSLNQCVAELDGYRELGVADRAVEAHYMLTTLLELCVEKGLFTKEDLARVAQRVQLKDLGWQAKPEGSQAEMGDILSIKFQVFDGDNLVDDQSAAPASYTLGCQTLSCDEQLVGIKVGEQRTVTGKFAAFKIPELVGKELKIVVLCVGLMIPNPK